MTREEAEKRAQTRVWCYMNKSDIDYYFKEYGLVVYKPDGKKKSSPNRAEKEDALIEYLTDKMATQDDKVTEAQQAAYEARMKHDVEVITSR